ncbi:hypothetical protein EIP91_002719 [Steccherinum ochraceum]|uniref:NAD-dependent epimerase/dehydratase domain-containing protein n=1 Tax=Steccherinum ochraceum TaxID=92696 RepID=A0A4R0RBM2_9APHY|nr:hypothetical protein EIP91_002719 [Steccherinum ochraceum]
MSAKPSAIIFGGLNTNSRTLAAHLVPLEGEALVSNLLIIDKYSVSPPTTYLGAEFPQVLAKPNVEYRQANLTVPATVASCFEPSEGQEPFTFVFDLSGEVQWDRPEEVQIERTFNVARLIGEEAARRNVKAYVRLQHPFYKCSEKGSHDEAEDVEPDDVLGRWWHESLRALAAIPNLNLVILRSALVYGPYVDFNNVMNFMVVAAVYGYMKQPMKCLWAPGKHPSHTVHSEDVAGALWALAEWMGRVGRTEALSVAGEVIRFKNEKSKVKAVEGVVPADTECKAPLFNLEDDSELTLATLGETMTSFFGAGFQFHNFVVNTTAKFKLEDMVEDINEAHVEEWTRMITTSNPPIPNTHYSAYMDLYNLRKHVVAFNAGKIKRVVGYKLRHPKMTNEVLKDIIDKLKAENSWPNLDS